jgi:hypothetical protein
MNGLILPPPIFEKALKFFNMTDVLLCKSKTANMCIPIRKGREKQDFHSLSNKTMCPVFMRSTASNHYDKIRLTIIQKSEGEEDSNNACAPDKKRSNQLCLSK